MSEEQQQSDVQPTEPVEPTTEPTSEASEANLDDELSKIYDSHEEEVEPEKAPSAPADPNKPTEQPADEVIPVPNTWGKDSQQLFSQLPKEIKQQIVKREQEREAVVRESFSARRFAQAMTPIAGALQDLEPYFKSFQKPDGQPLWGDAQAMAKEIKDVLAVKQLLLSDPAAGLHVVTQWARAAGLQLPEEMPDTNALNMRVRLAQLEQQEKQRAIAMQQQQQQQQQQQFVNNLAGGINNLGAAKDEAGNLLYPHLHGEYGEQLGNMMGRWMRANMDNRGITPELFKEAYETAVFSLPQTRDVEFKKREDARIADYKKRSQAARRAQGVNPSPGRVPTAEPETDLEQQMLEIWNKYQ